MSSRIFFNVPCSTVTMTHCHSQLQKMPAAYRHAMSVNARSSGIQSGSEAPTMGRMYVSINDCRNSDDPACAAAPTRMHTTTSATRHLYWKM